MSRILIIHGPNLNLLGGREPQVYGSATLENINEKINNWAKANNVTLEIFQSNHEGEIVDLIGKSKQKFDIMIINPAAYTHTSVAIRDAISAVGIPTIEVHISNIYAREDFRQNSLVGPVSVGQICGFGDFSYILALEAALSLLAKKE